MIIHRLFLERRKGEKIDEKNCTCFRASAVGIDGGKDVYKRQGMRCGIDIGAAVAGLIMPK